MKIKQEITGRCCEVCGCWLPLSNDRIYPVVVRSTTSILGDRTAYDAIDCPRCGCQTILHIRHERLNKRGEK